MRYLLCLFFLFSSPLQAAESCTIDVTVNGLVCDFCARALEKVFSKQESVDSIAVDLENGLVAVTMKPGEKPLDDTTLTELITDSGYNVNGIQPTC